jgi:O-acetyl-ADP-ribose deacetylase (regulator of RNase III)
VSSITYLFGDATQPQAPGPKVIAHICNDAGGWGRGFVLSLSKRWTEPERSYRRWHRNQAQESFGLGLTQMVQVEETIWVANMIAQTGYGPNSLRIPPIRYEALLDCLVSVQEFTSTKEASVHMPRIGCGLAGGTWPEIEPMIKLALVNKGVPVFVYDLPRVYDLVSQGPGRASIIKEWESKSDETPTA